MIRGCLATNNPTLSRCTGRSTISSHTFWLHFALIRVAGVKIGVLCLCPRGRFDVVGGSMKLLIHTLLLVIVTVVAILVQTLGNKPGENFSARYILRAEERVKIRFFCAHHDYYLIRAVGPTLSTRGVPGALSDPALRVLTWRNLTAAINDDWSIDKNGISFSTHRTGAFPLVPDSKDAAVVLSLDRGFYTVEVNVSEKLRIEEPQTTGIVLVEILKLGRGW